MRAIAARARKAARAFACGAAMLAAALVAAAPIGAMFATPAAAQQAQKDTRRLNLFDLLFGGAPVLRNPLAKKPDRARRVIVAPGAGAGFAGGQTATKVIVQKSETALKVLVVGDFLAEGLSFGLDQAFADNPGVAILDRTSGLSGLVRPEVVDWEAKLGELLAEVKPAAVVVQLGMNDRQAIRGGAARLNKLTDEWKEEYAARISRLVKTATSQSIAVIWVGLPPAKSGINNVDFLAMNELYRGAAEAAGGKFVDVWDGFTNAEGEFIAAGPDIDGQIVRLRNADGVNMTKPGKRKMAFYAERELRKVPGLGFAQQDAVAAAEPAVLQVAPDYDPARSRRTVIISLDSPASDGGAALEGGGDFLKDANGEAASSFDLVRRGIAANPVAGRIDSGWGLSSPPETKPKS
jgi:hypothetical protein